MAIKKIINLKAKDTMKEKALNFLKAICLIGLIILAIGSVQSGFYCNIDKWYIFGLSVLTVFIIGYEFSQDKTE